MTRRRYASIQGYHPRLVVRTSPEKGEGFLGWVLRLTQINGYEFSEWILRSAGMRAPDLLSREGVIERLRLMTQVAVHDLQTLVPRLDTAGWRWAEIPGMDISVALFDARKPKVCPVCLAEKGFVQAAWGLRIWTCCPDHECRLVNVCPRCGSPITWRRRHVDLCPNPNCGGRYSSSEIQRAGEEEVELALLLGQALGSETLSRLPALTSVFGELSPQDIVTMASRLGFRRMRETYRGSADSSDIAEAAIKAARLLSNWPTGFHDFIRSQRVLADGSTTGGAARDPEITFLLRAKTWNGEFLLPSEARFIFAKEFQNFLDITGDGRAPALRQALAGEGSSDRWMSLPQAAKALGIDRRTLARMARDGSLVGIRFVQNDKTFTFVDRHEIERRLKATGSGKTLANLRRNGEALSHGTASRLLGIRPNKVAPLLEDGLLSAISGTSGRFVDRASAVRLLEKLEANVPGCGSHADRRLIYDTCEVVQRVRGHGMAFILRAVLAGTLRPVDILIDGVGLRRIGFLRTEVARFERDHRKSNGNVHISDAARQLDCYNIDIRRLIASNLLRHGETSIDVDAKSIRSFQTKHVSGRAFAREYGITTGRLDRLLREMDVEPVLPVTDPRISTSFWRRNDTRRLQGRFERRRLAIDDEG
ncbi:MULTISPECIES: TniQ family protein [Methylobacterium]|jgi:hypothetical protein|uniref:TniQ domain-containing protein n=1 Tax=Methylobacterium mesophilicum SR1.6/6 TaxID=908290 RepID=A0A6B9FMG6_9HYPH|nr:TniQ family protein [Methylobacterium mesophilicum]QGY02906.1 hypothetical protein MMSR116_14205 [Methylobacterium mesophilicum SR1.6/6]